MPKGPLGDQIRMLQLSKKIALMVSGAAVQKYRETLQEQQEILGILSDLAIELFAMESALLRALKSAAAEGEKATEAKSDMVKVYFNDAFARIELLAKDALASMEEGDTLRTQLSALKKLTRSTPINTTRLRRAIAGRIIESEGYRADPLFAIGPDLLLPDRHGLFEAVNGVGAGCQGLVAMRGRDGNGHAYLADLQVSDPVDHGDLVHLPLPADLVGNLSHLRDRHLPVGLVFKVEDLPPPCLLPDDAKEAGHSARTRPSDSAHKRFERKRLVGDVKHPRLR
jgi:hypothetical protein